MSLHAGAVDETILRGWWYGGERCLLMYTQNSKDKYVRCGDGQLCYMYIYVCDFFCVCVFLLCVKSTLCMCSFCHKSSFYRLKIGFTIIYFFFYFLCESFSICQPLFLLYRHPKLKGQLFLKNLMMSSEIAT